MAQTWESPEIIAQGKLWAAAQATKNTAAMKAASVEANRLRATQGYQTAGDGTNQSALAGYQADSTNTKFTPIQQQQPQQMQQMQQPQYDLSGQLEALKNAQISNSIAGLTQAKNKSLASINTEKAQIAPQYQGQRNVAATQSDIKVKNLAEYMANRGSLGAGGNDQIRTSIETMGLGKQSDLNRQELARFDDIARRITGVEQDYNAGVQQAQSGADVQFIQNTLAELGKLRDYGREDSRTAVLDNRYADETKYNQGRDTVTDNRYNQEFDYQKQQDALDRDFQQRSFDAEQKYRNGQITLEQKQQEIDNAFKEKEFERSKLESDRNYNLSASRANNSSSSGGSGSSSKEKPTYTPTQVTSQAKSYMETKDANGEYVYTIGEFKRWLANQNITDRQHDDILDAIEVQYPNRSTKIDSNGRINYGVPIGPGLN